MLCLETYCLYFVFFVLFVVKHFHTNVPADFWPKEALGTLYRLRWQIELTVKHWKSLFRSDLLKSTRPERIRCLLYGRLIFILIVQKLLALTVRPENPVWL